MTNELKCPKCGGAHVVEDECYDVIGGAENTVKELMCGYCEDCGIDVQWARVYKFMGYDDIEEG